LLDRLGKLDLELVREQRSLGNFTEIQPHRVVNEVGVETLQHVQIPFEVCLRFLDDIGQLCLDFLRNIDPVVA